MGEEVRVRTIGSIMQENRGIGPGFDLLRIGLAFAVILRHCFPISYGNGPDATAGYAWAAAMGILPSFFILSGFLVTGSALRLSLGKFVASRVLRIVPALAVDTLITVLLIGPLFTEQSLADYFSSPMTHGYLLNVVGEIHYLLPGVFGDNPLHGIVNGALWTIQPELGCYAVICALIALGWVQDWHKAAAVLAAAIIAIIMAQGLPDRMPHLIGMALNHPGAMLVPNFMLGSILYLKRDSIPYSPRLFSGGVVIVLLSGLVLPAAVFSTLPVISIVMSPIYAYLTLFLGATKMPAVPFFQRGDYSYGIYLYGFPIQQAIVASTEVRKPILLFAATILPVVATAVLSWHLIEKPTLRLRKGFSMAAKIERERHKG